MVVVGSEMAMPREITFAAEGPATLAIEVATSTMSVGCTFTSFALAFLNSILTYSTPTVVYPVRAHTSYPERQVYASLALSPGPSISE